MAAAIQLRRAHELCRRLLNCDTEDEVIGVLKAERLWTDRSAWKPYGDIPNNRGVVGNQQSSPVAALVEKLVNSIDAILTSECHRHGIDPTGADAPQSMRAAVEKFLDIPAGKIAPLDPRARTELAKRIHLIAAGTKLNPSYVIVDEGEGQLPERFPDTFLSLLRENKARIPFVQGKYNMGATGVLQFAGTNSFQLILSRRQPHLLLPAEVKRGPRWGFTLIRRIDPGPDQPHTTYVYLAPGGQIPWFEAETLDLKPGPYPTAHGTPLAAGTLIKLWNYKAPGLKTIATLDFRHALERFLQDPALPIRISERRQGYRANYYDTTMAGLVSVLADNTEKIEPGLDTGSPLDVPGVGRVHIRLVVLSDNLVPEDSKQFPAGVHFNVNGQLHGERGTDFISRRTRLDYVAESMIVLVDCTELPTRVREDLFLASRDRMRLIEERTALENAIVEYLQEHQGLRELNARRRQERITSVSESETEKVIQSLVRSDPTLAALFGRGERVRIHKGPLPEPEPYGGQRFPTYFRLTKEPQGGLVKRCPRNRSTRVEFETDAVNDYFSRTVDPGHLETRGVPKLMSVHLWNGRAGLRFSVPEDSNVGDRYRVVVQVNDVSRVSPFEASFVIEVEADADVREPGPPAPPPGSFQTALPNIVEVKRHEWARHGFNEYSALALKYGEEQILDVFVNMDNIYLGNEITRRRGMDPDALRYFFKYGLALLALGMLYQQRQGAQGDPAKAENFAQISDACRGLAVTLIPVMVHLADSATRKPTRAAASLAMS